MSAAQKDLFSDEPEPVPEQPAPAPEPVAEKKGKKSDIRCANGMPLEGERYDVGLQDAKDPCCFKDFYECDHEGEAKAVADGKAIEEGLDTIVYDKIEMEIIYRVKAKKRDQPVETPQPAQATRRGRKK